MAGETDDGVDRLASRIAQCIDDADKHGMHAVAAHLDTALTALRSSLGCSRRDESFDQGKRLH